MQAKTFAHDLNKGGKTTNPTDSPSWGCGENTSWKPQTDVYRALPELEDLTMHLAEGCEISVVPHSLIRFQDGELLHHATHRPVERRFQTADGRHVPTSERLTEYKYKGCYEQIAKLIKIIPPRQLDLVNYWEVVVFSWITGNSDMHLKTSRSTMPRAASTRSPPPTTCSPRLWDARRQGGTGAHAERQTRKIMKTDFVRSINRVGNRRESHRQSGEEIQSHAAQMV